VCPGREQRKGLGVNRPHRVIVIVLLIVLLAPLVLAAGAGLVYLVDWAVSQLLSGAGLW